MTVKEFTRMQHDNPDCIYLLSQGAFYRAYNEGAEHLNAVLGYRLRQDKFGIVAGFPIASLTSVYCRIMKYYADRLVTMENIGNGHILMII